MILDKLDVRGTPTIRLYDAKGSLKKCLTENNLVVDTGKNYLIRKAFDQFPGEEPSLDVIAVGTGTTPVQSTDTSLEAQFADTTISSFTFFDANEITLVAGFIQSVGTGTINELGLLASDDTLISRIVVSESFEKSETDFLSINWKIQIG